MQDRVSLYPGRVKLTPVFGQENTYDMVRADDPTQEGTPLNKDSLLKDATSALFGLGADAVPDDALSLLSRFHNGMGNEYVWEKIKSTEKPAYITEEQVPDNKIVGAISLPNTILTSESIEVSDDGVVSHVNSETHSFSRHSTENDYKVIIGKYFSITDFSDNELLFSNAGGSLYGSTIYHCDSAAKITSPYNSEAGYFVVTINGDVTKPVGHAKEIETTSFGYVNSPDQNAYPPTEDDGYTYTPFGQLGGFSKIATGSYVGTGTYGADNPCSLTFGFRPIFLAMFSASGFLIQYGTESMSAIASLINLTDYYQENVLWPWGDNSSDYTNAKFDYATNTLYWYHTADVNYQLNTSGITYYYIAIG